MISLWILNFQGGGPYHLETSPLIFRAIQWTGLYMIGTSIMKELIKCNLSLFYHFIFHNVKNPLLSSTFPAELKSWC